jgi:CubicO group peptidase (beta-lactamase class C family)
MPRRTFLARGGRTAVGLSLLPWAACSDSLPPARDRASLVPSELIAALESQIPPLLTAAHVPALSIAIVADGQLAWSRGFGVRITRSNTPVDADSVYEACSVSKTVFAYAVMKLSERGAINLDTPLTKSVSDRWLDDPRFDRITARHVLSHTSGLQNWRSKDDPLRIHFTPGEKWFYSGEAYSYLQLVVSRLTGRINETTCETMPDGLRVCETDFDAYMRTNLLKPLGMTSSGYLLEEALVDRLAHAHDKDGKPTDRPRATPVTAARFGSAGNLLTTANDYARFIIEVVDPGPQDAFRLARATRDEMIRPHVKMTDTLSWALGWQVERGKSGTVISHSGDNPGYKTFMLASVERKSGYVMLTNSDSGFDVMGKLINGDTPLNVFVRDGVRS